MDRCSDDRSSWSLYTSKVDSVLHETPPGAKKPLVFSYASITPIDLIQLNKSDSRNFYESNPTEARFEIILFSTVLLE